MEDHLPDKLLHRWVKVMAGVLIAFLIGPFVLKRWSLPP